MVDVDKPLLVISMSTPEIIFKQRILTTAKNPIESTRGGYDNVHWNLVSPSYNGFCSINSKKTVGLEVKVSCKMFGHFLKMN